MLENGFIKLYRSLLKWEWYDDPVTKCLFIHLLLTVNIKRTHWRGITIEAGSRFCSEESLARELNFSRQQVRTGISHLINTGEITRTKYPKFSVISVVNWGQYQTGQPANPPAFQPAANQVPTSNPPYNKKNKEYQEEKEIRAAREDAPSGLSEEELRELKRKMRE